jgi:hypothetical protein
VTANVEPTHVDAAAGTAPTDPEEGVGVVVGTVAGGGVVVVVGTGVVGVVVGTGAAVAGTGAVVFGVAEELAVAAPDVVVGGTGTAAALVVVVAATTTRVVNPEVRAHRHGVAARDRGRCPRNRLLDLTPACPPSVEKCLNPVFTF